MILMLFAVPSVAPPQMTVSQTLVSSSASGIMAAVTPPIASVATAPQMATAAPTAAGYPTFSAGAAAAGHQQPNSLPAIQPSPNNSQQIYYVS